MRFSSAAAALIGERGRSQTSVNLLPEDKRWSDRTMSYHDIKLKDALRDWSCPCSVYAKTLDTLPCPARVA